MGQAVSNEMESTVPVVTGVMFERPGGVDWEVLADADAEYREWLEARHAVDLSALDLDARFAAQPQRNDDGDDTMWETARSAA
jgi:hypothetical protein